MDDFVKSMPFGITAVAVNSRFEKFKFLFPISILLVLWKRLIHARELFGST
ncbi:hypothetical protein HRQ65_08415 [Tatlockia micdadei]|uniref:hypothetical protein n=1 Tax=Legionella micdadei TaxID=451 RepID=UPI00156F8C04|nr:hypothetical protein [Legionella micdadei]NSL18402.1 hypothetical protein [Legionella micdadei]